MKIELTTNSPCSHYGIPSLQIDGVDYGPSDRVETTELCCETAAKLVCQMTRDGDFDLEDAERFCAQWPDGPQPREWVKLRIIIWPDKTDLSTFEPMSGSYGLDKNSPEMEEISRYEIEEAIAGELKARHGFMVKVEIFHSNGHAITDETPSNGNFLATRI